jgi:hypothetical protein
VVGDGPGYVAWESPRLADGAYGERVWVRGEGPEVDSPTETLCRLLDDYDLAGFLDRAAAEGWLADRELATLQALARALDDLAIGDGLAGSQWQTVRRLAARVLDAFAQEGAAQG